MNNLLINATKNYGDKILLALKENEINRNVEGVYVSLADLPKKQIDKLVKEIDGLSRIFYDFPIYFILEDNLYITQNKMDNSLNNSKKKNTTNKLEVLMENLNFSNFSDFPLQPSSYVQNRDYIHKIILNFYNQYYKYDSEIILPTFILKDLNSWKEIMIEDTFSYAQRYAEENDKKITCSFIIDFSYLDKEDVSQRLYRYFERYNRFSTVSITLTIDKVGINTYNPQQYLSYMNFVNDLTSKNIKVRIQNAGLKDIILSIFDVQSFSVGWSSSYRGMNLEQRKITNREVVSFGRKTKKVFLSKLMSEIPLSYFDVFTVQENMSFFGDQFKGFNHITFNWIEQKYWIEFVKVINFIRNDTLGKENNIDYSTINSRVELFQSVLRDAKNNLQIVIDRLEQKGRLTDASRLKTDQLRCIINNEEALKKFKNSIFDF